MQNTLNACHSRFKHTTQLIQSFTAFCILLCSFAAQANSCQIEVTNLNFSTYIFTDNDGISTNGEIRVNCDDTINFQVRFSTGSSQNYSARTLTKDTAILAYNVYANPTFNQILGDGSNGTHVLNGSNAAGQTTTLPFYGYISPAQNIPIGIYQDNITVTLVY